MNTTVIAVKPIEVVLSRLVFIWWFSIALTGFQLGPRFVTHQRTSWPFQHHRNSECLKINSMYVDLGSMFGAAGNIPGGRM